jgi:hypothetical protein
MTLLEPALLVCSHVAVVRVCVIQGIISSIFGMSPRNSKRRRQEEDDEQQEVEFQDASGGDASS